MKKLKLNKHTILRLSPAEAALVKGGKVRIEEIIRTSNGCTQMTCALDCYPSVVNCEPTMDCTMHCN